MSDITTLITEISQRQTFALFGHQNPDGDAIWSILAMRHILISQGKQVSCYVPDKPSKRFDFLSDIDTIQTDFDYSHYDCLMFLDFSGYDRIIAFTDWHETYFDQMYKVVIDHHINPNPPGHINIIDTSASSNCERMYENLHPYYQIDPQTATYLYLGLTTDTGNFSYEQDSHRTFSNALKLIEAWADKAHIINNLWRSNTYGQIHFLSLLIDRLTQAWWVARSRYSEQDLESYHIDQEEANFGLGILQSIADISITILFKYRSDYLQVSLRSKNIDKQIAPDVSQIARHFGGGWHRQASWFRIPWIQDQTKQMNDVIAYIQTHLNNLSS